MGGDSAATNAWLDIWNLTSPKVFRNEDMVIGVSGRNRALQLMQYRLDPPEHSPKKNIEKYLTVDFADALRKAFGDAGNRETQHGVEAIPESYALVGYRGRLFTVWGDFGWTESSEPYAAIGCGAPYALGALATLQQTTAMAPSDRVRQALAVAAKFSAGVREPFHVIEVLAGEAPATA